MEEMLLYLMKHSRPDIINAALRLTKVSDKANKLAFEEMFCESVFELKIFNEKFPYGIIGFSNNNYVRDIDIRRSNSGFILHIFGVTIN